MGDSGELFETFRFVHPSLVGTFVTVTLAAPHGALTDDQAEAIDDAIVDDVDRLEQIFSVYRPDSELERWKRGEVDGSDLSPEFRTVMAQALNWQERSGGTFTTMSDAVTVLWREAAERGSAPTHIERTAAIDATMLIPYEIAPGGTPVPGDGARFVNLNAFAKGWIVDQVIDTVMRNRPTGSPLSGVTISAGGDLRHRGIPSIIIGVENPLRPYDNEPPLAQIEIIDSAVATSGVSRKGFRVGERFYSHVIDPRTALTVDRIASTTVVAPDAATADVLATVIGLADPDDAVDIADHYRVAMMMVLPDGEQLRNRAFEQLLVRGAA